MDVASGDHADWEDEWEEWEEFEGELVQKGYRVWLPAATVFFSMVCILWLAARYGNGCPRRAKESASDDMQRPGSQDAEKTELSAGQKPNPKLLFGVGRLSRSAPKGAIQLLDEPSRR